MPDLMTELQDAEAHAEAMGLLSEFHKAFEHYRAHYDIAESIHHAMRVIELKQKMTEKESQMNPSQQLRGIASHVVKAYYSEFEDRNYQIFGSIQIPYAGARYSSLSEQQVQEVLDALTTYFGLDVEIVSLDHYHGWLEIKLPPHTEYDDMFAMSLKLKNIEDAMEHFYDIGVYINGENFEAQDLLSDDQLKLPYKQWQEWWGIKPSTQKS